MTVKTLTFSLAAACAALILAGCSSPQPSKEAIEEKKAAPPAEPSKAPEPPPKTAEAPKPAEEPKPAEPAKATPPPKAPKPAKPAETANLFKVKFTTSKGPVVVEIHRDWAPKGAQQFYQLVKSGYFDGNRFFRIVPNFIVQFGMSGNPAMTQKWDKPIPDDPVMQTNRAGSLTFATAGPNTRTTQLFINLRANQMLDGQGFAPFGMVVEGMSAIESLNKEYGERPDQGQIRARGNAYLNEQFPNLDYIKKAEVLPVE